MYAVPFHAVVCVSSTSELTDPSSGFWAVVLCPGASPPFPTVQQVILTLLVVLPAVAFFCYIFAFRIYRK